LGFAFKITVFAESFKPQYLLWYEGYRTKKIKSQIMKALKENGTYNKRVDDFQVDNLVFNLVLIHNSKADILKRGQMVNLRKSEDDPFYQINFSISVFHNAVKSINTILKSLGLEKAKVESNPQRDAMQALQDLLKS
jgi:hypothetical protein